eukprot:630025-Rhodomonas_salina.1
MERLGVGALVHAFHGLGSGVSWNARRGCAGSCTRDGVSIVDFMDWAAAFHGTLGVGALVHVLETVFQSFISWTGQRRFMER